MLQEPHYDKADKGGEIAFLLEHLGITRADFERAMKESPRKHSEFRSSAINRIAGFMLAGRKAVLGY